jgi:hypothetical protein
MAKGKNSPALFEVISRGKLKPPGGSEASTSTPASTSLPIKATRRSLPRLSVPSWLFGRKGNTPKPVRFAAPPVDSVPAEPANLSSPASDAFDRAERAATVVFAGDDPTDQQSSGHDLVNDDNVAIELEPQGSSSASSTLDPTSAPRRAAKRRPKLKITYTTAFVAGFAVVMVTGLAYIASRSGPRPVVGGTTLDALRSKPASGDVLNVRSGSAVVEAPPRLTPGELSRQAAAGTLATEPQLPSGKPATADGTVAAPDVRRVIGRNYIIAQSYPDADVARRAADILTRNGVPATVEQLPAFSASWHCVVTQVGFDSVRSAEFSRYIDAIKKLNGSEEMKRIRGFDPTPFKWR